MRTKKKTRMRNRIAGVGGVGWTGSRATAAHSSRRRHTSGADPRDAVALGDRPFARFKYRSHLGRELPRQQVREHLGCKESLPGEVVDALQLWRVLARAQQDAAMLQECTAHLPLRTPGDLRTPNERSPGV